MLNLSSALAEFRSIAADIAKLRGCMAQAESIADETSRHYLDALGKTIDETVKQLNQQFPEAVAHLQETKAQTQTRMDELRATVEDLKRKGEEAQRKAAARPEPKPPIPSVTPLHAGETDATIRRYREELLRLLNEQGEGADRAKKPDREIWQDWSRIEEE